MNAERRQVDLLGCIECIVEYEPRAPDDPERVELCTIAGHLRNASELPIRVRRIAYRVETEWCVPEEEASSQMPVWSLTPGAVDRRIHNNQLVPPGDELVLPFVAHLAHLAPDGAVQLVM